jgi:ABC-type Mn2+/Zn2+ transport system permease subunit
MKKFDIVSVVYGVLFVLAGLYFSSASNRPSFSDLGLVIPVVLIAVGLAVIAKNSRKRR